MSPRRLSVPHNVLDKYASWKRPATDPKQCRDQCPNSTYNYLFDSEKGCLCFSKEFEQEDEVCYEEDFSFQMFKKEPQTLVILESAAVKIGDQTPVTSAQDDLKICKHPDNATWNKKEK